MQALTFPKHQMAFTHSYATKFMMKPCLTHQGARLIPLMSKIIWHLLELNTEVPFAH